jgi:transmembrane sensor
MTAGFMEESSSESDADPVVKAATDWLLACDRGLTPQEKTRLTDWLEQDERHAEVYDQLKQTWSWFAEVPEARFEAARDLPTVETRGGVRLFRRAWFAIPLATAAALAIGFFGWRYYNVRHFTDSIVTEVGATQEIRLPDGSLVQLNTDTALNVEYTPTERKVHLSRGEAHFEVAKNPERPFIVNTAHVNVRAVGTAFNVRLRQESIEVLVTEGKVRVSDSANGRSVLPTTETTHTAASSEPVLGAGERAVVRYAEMAAPISVATVAPLPTPEIDELLSWRERQLQFVGRPLSEIVSEFNRYNRHKLVIGDSRLAEKRFGVTFPANDYAGFVRLLQKEFGIVAEDKGSETVLKLP